MVELTKGEQLLINRKRKKLNQHDEAKEWGVKFDTYSLWERDMRPGDCPVVRNENITDLELTYIFRRRCNLTRAKLAKDLGISKTWLNYMERGLISPKPLIKYWKKHEAGI